jgi:transposase
VAFLIAFVFCVAQNTSANDELLQLNSLLQSLNIPQSEESKKNEQRLARILQVFGEVQGADDKEVKYLLKQWDEYLISTSHYSNTDHVTAINTQLTNYYEAIADIGSNIKKNDGKQKSEYSSSWVDDLVSRFGIEFVKKNKGVILQSWEAIFSSNEAFEQNLKDLVYIETMLFGSYEDYFGMFLTFYTKELDQNAQEKMASYKKIAKYFLALIDKASFASIHNTTVLKRVLAENKARHLNEEVFQFFKNHPLAHTFKEPRALRDLRKVVDN